MFGRVFAIALNTYRESLRARILLALAAVAFATVLYSLVVGAYTLKNAPRVVSDLGAASISIFSVLCTVLIGATSLHRELDQKTLFPILARPIRRSEFLVGKYLGVLLTIGVFVMADAGLVLMLGAGLAGKPVALLIGVGLGITALFALVGWKRPAMRTYGPIPWAASVLVVGAVLAQAVPDERRLVLASSALTMLEIGIVAALAMLFSSFSTPIISALFTVGMFIIGRQADVLAHLPVKQFGQMTHDAGVFVSKIVPNLQIFVPARPLLIGDVIDVKLFDYLGMASITSLGWSVGLLAISVLVFNERDFL